MDNIGKYLIGGLVGASLAGNRNDNKEELESLKGQLDEMKRTEDYHRDSMERMAYGAQSNADSAYERGYADGVFKTLINVVSGIQGMVTPHIIPGNMLTALNELKYGLSLLIKDTAEYAHMDLDEIQTKFNLEMGSKAHSNEKKSEFLKEAKKAYEEKIQKNLDGDEDCRLKSIGECVQQLQREMGFLAQEMKYTLINWGLMEKLNEDDREAINEGFDKTILAFHKKVDEQRFI